MIGNWASQDQKSKSQSHSTRNRTDEQIEVLYFAGLTNSTHIGKIWLACCKIVARGANAELILYNIWLRRDKLPFTAAGLEEGLL